MAERCANLPIISLSALRCLCPKELEKLRRACTTEGFFYASDHGIGEEIVNEATVSALRFFSLPLEKKLQFSQEHQSITPKTCRGYVPAGGETLDSTRGADPKEIFDDGLEVEGEKGRANFMGRTFLPDETTAPGFAASTAALRREVVDKVMPPLCKAFSILLGHKETFLDEFMSPPTLIQRCIFYPANCNSFAGKHTDNGLFTALLVPKMPTTNEPSPHDTNGSVSETGDDDKTATPPKASLEVFTQGRWIPVPPLKGCFPVNIGDLLQHISGGTFVSTPHRVEHHFSPSPRISFPFFFYPFYESRVPVVALEEEEDSSHQLIKVRGGEGKGNNEETGR
eukprot:Cvel_11096.t1-p1 / transcript=Cvel_11096.t1 / gene=Cvel_11096 / organism=Chromera_velia_CCMP2878 / gene_product=Probable iron/ascorbate oxidoreductase DDB_G0283291, putative / transcript_product=Probable iron/ascorbate oxidoreductase DDB_G0283291, putative / location=Cvel_scaffold687:2346-4051(+) / protein_length=339 / sequence_SO=supercontig / SO=protein_coding / is_pseudo=false